MSSITDLQASLTRLGGVLLGYSGGVDSALLAVVARRAVGSDRFLAVIGRSTSYPAEQYQRALDLASEFDLPLLELDTHELDDPAYRVNNTDRCYHCKRELWARLTRVAEQRGLAAVIDGTNVDDLHEHRPGLQAATEFHVRSPLAELGWTKAMVRAAARQLGIPTWDAPASPCLSSRIQYGLEVTPDRLQQVEEAERIMRRFGVTGDLRVRHRGDCASVEVDPTQHPSLQRRWDEVAGALAALGFARLELDPRGYRRGALLGELPVLAG
jgi:uncharacterized protein